SLLKDASASLKHRKSAGKLREKHPRKNDCSIWSRLRRDPLSGLGRSEDRFDHGHVADRVFESYWDFGILRNSPGKSIALHRVLIACRISFRWNPQTCVWAGQSAH